MFYELTQNNSGGYFKVDDKLCNMLIIEADSEKEALNKAEDLGCYWDGVDKGIDCPCCGDRWYRYAEEIKINSPCIATSRSYNDENKNKIVTEFYNKYSKYNLTDVKEENSLFREGEKYLKGTIYFNTAEDYADYYNNESIKWTTPNIRIFFKDGTIKEF